MASKVFSGQAPGRLDVMGGIADYSGSLVLQLPIKQKTTVEFSFRKDFICSIESETNDGERLSTSIDYQPFITNNFDYSFCRKNLNHSWYAYVVGCVIVLQKKKRIHFAGGDFKIHSDVPLGKGVSSSASLEVAMMKALSEAFNVSFEGTSMALLAQEVENEIVGAPCGLMDQLTTSYGETGKLLPIICQPDKLLEPIPVPAHLKFIGIDSGVRHSVGGASYGDVRCAAFMGYSIIAHALGINRSMIQDVRATNDRLSIPYQGYLCNISVSEFEHKFRTLLPLNMKGKDFIDRFGTTIDTATEVKKETNYQILQSTLHPIYENERVKKFKSIIERLNVAHNDTSNDVDQLGQLMFQSHQSYSACGLGSERTDEFVKILINEKNNGVAGAKITGGGSGGTVCALAIGDKGEQTVRKIHRSLCEKYKTNLSLF